MKRRASSSSKKGGPKKPQNVPKKPARANEDEMDEIDEFTTHKNFIAFDKQSEPNSARRKLDNEVLPLSDSDESRSSGYDSSQDGSSDEEMEVKPDANWGSRKQNYYATDYVDDEIISSDSGADEEEEVARGWQKKKYSETMAEDFEDTIGVMLKQKKKPKNIDELTSKDQSLVSAFLGEADKDLSVKKDVSGLTKADQLDILMNSAPELFALLENFRQKISFLKESHDLLSEDIDSALSDNGRAFLRAKLNSELLYCIHICYYLLRSSKGEAVKNHPVIRQILRLNSVCDSLSDINIPLVDEQDSSGQESGEGSGSEEDSDEVASGGSGDLVSSADESDDLLAGLDDFQPLANKTDSKKRSFETLLASVTTPTAIEPPQKKN